MPSGAVLEGRGRPLQPKSAGLPGIMRQRVGLPLKIFRLNSLLLLLLACFYSQIKPLLPPSSSSSSPGGEGGGRGREGEQKEKKKKGRDYWRETRHEHECLLV